MEEIISDLKLQKKLDKFCDATRYNGVKDGEAPCVEKSLTFFVKEAVDRYKRLNKAETYDHSRAEPFLSALKRLSWDTLIITFSDVSAKARFTFKRTEFVVDYDFEETEPVYVSAYKSEVLVFKACPLEKLKDILEEF